MKHKKRKMANGEEVHTNDFADVPVLARCQAGRQGVARGRRTVYRSEHRVGIDCGGVVGEPLVFEHRLLLITFF